MGSAWTRGLAVTGAIAAALAYPAASVAGRMIGTPYIQAHRGGSIVHGKPAYPENTMPAFRHSAKRGFIPEMDAKLTKDGVPVIMHDAILDRTTDCTGRVVDRTLAELRRCRVNILGTEGNSVHINPSGPRAASIPTLPHVLDFIRKHEAKASIEIKNIPTDPDFDSTERFATIVSKTIRASRVPQSRLIVQSFWPPDLTVAQRILPLADFSFLTTSAGNAGGPPYAATHGIQWVSPQSPVDARYVADAHARGREIVPYTIDGRRGLVRAADEGVDAIITNDPGRARRVLHQAASKAASIPAPPTNAQCRATRARLHTRPIKNLDPARRAPRVFAMQFKQEARNVASYRAFRKKIECTIREYVVPHLARHRPNIVAFNEDVGLMTLGTGSRGADARKTIGHPGSVASCEGKPAPCVAALALGQITAAYGPEGAAYRPDFRIWAGSRRASSLRPTRSRGDGCRRSRTWRAATTSTSSARTRRRVSRVARPVRDPSVR